MLIYRDSLVSKADDIPLQLIYKRYRFNINAIKTNNYFQRQLEALLKCEKLQKGDFQNPRYTTKSLSKIFVNYHSCINPDSGTAKVQEQNRSTLALAIRPGLNLMNFIYNTDGAPFQPPSVAFGTLVGLQIGLELAYNLPFNRDKWCELGVYCRCLSSGRRCGALADFLYGIDIPCNKKPWQLVCQGFLLSQKVVGKMRGDRRELDVLLSGFWGRKVF